MKISKVEHMKTAVTGNKGVVYKSPSPKESSGKTKLDVKSHVKGRDTAQKNMYSLLGRSFMFLEREFKDDLKNEEFEFQKKLAETICGRSYLQKFENWVLKNNRLDDLSPNIKDLENCGEGEWDKSAKRIVESRIKQQIIYIKKYRNNEPNIQFKQDKYEVDGRKFVCKLVTFQSRKSLRKTVKERDGYGNEVEIYIPDVMEKLLWAICHPKEGYMAEIKTVELKAFLRTVNNDYLHLNRTREIANSIEKKNVKVQVADGELLQLSSASHENKGAIFEFLKEYTSEENQNQLLDDFQKLLVLFLEPAVITERLKKKRGKIWHKNRYQWDNEDVFGFPENDVVKYNGESIDHLLCKKNKESISQAEKKKIRKQIEETVHKMVLAHYMVAKKELDRVKIGDKEYKEKIFWLQFIEKTTWKALNEDRLRKYKLRLSWLYNYIWREWVSYLAGKYIDMGKAVYHFATPDLQKEKEISIKGVLPEYKSGITSFDYEMIKAEENLERELAVYISYAINRFSRAVAPETSFQKIIKNKKSREIEHTDLLFLNAPLSITDNNEKDFQVYEDYVRRILQFFGGKSRYCGLEEEEKFEMIYEMKERIAYVRNFSFHYTSVMEIGDTQTNYSHKLIASIYKQEIGMVKKLLREKYYSNNVPAFYKEEHITSLMEVLYNKPKSNPAQIPSFSKVLPRTHLEEFLAVLGIKGSQKDGDVTPYHNCIYFVLKEIYYYAFLKENELLERFKNALENRCKLFCDKTEKWAVENFKKRVDCLLKNSISMGELAQIIMTDYNMQNQNKEVLTNEDKHKAEIYKHFPILLAKVLCDAFADFLKSKFQETETPNIYGFLQSPTEKEMPAKEAFCDVEWKCGISDGQYLEGKGELLYAWYVTAHFLNPRNLNLLVGSIKNYIAYVNSIFRRSNDAGCKVAPAIEGKIKGKIAILENVVSVLEVVRILSGRVSDCFSDYFPETKDAVAKDQYTEYLRRFVDVDNEVCKKYYYDTVNPKPERNVILSLLYGNQRLMAETMSLVNEEEITEYIKLRDNDEVKGSLKKRFCNSKDEQEQKIRFQHLKNRIELHDVLVLSEIENDLVSQMISWSYLRERDLMYYQLGYHYIKLYYGNTKREEWKRKIETEEIKINEGALLYQIIAMYSFNLPVYTKKGNGWSANQSGTGAAISHFKTYSGGDYSVYNDGLNLFEEVNTQHDEAVMFRNYHNHFKYYAHYSMSILEMYAQIYHNFFSYDRKLQKSVSFIFVNILKRYFVNARTKLGKNERGVELSVSSLESDCFTYKIKDNKEKKEKKIKVKVREDVFLDQLKEILSYRKEE